MSTDLLGNDRGLRPATGPSPQMLEVYRVEGSCHSKKVRNRSHSGKMNATIHDQGLSRDAFAFTERDGLIGDILKAGRAL